MTFVEVDEFEATDPGLRGEMTTDHETGWREALARLGALVEAR